MDLKAESPNFKRLPILTVLYEALWYVWSLRRQIGLAILVPVCASTLALVSYYAQILPNTKLVGWGVWAVYAVSWCFAAVACHRLVLLGLGSVAKFGVNGRSNREWKFLILLALIGAITVVLLLLLAFVLQGGDLFATPGERQTLNTLQAIGSMISVPAYVLLLTCMVPLGLVLPATAIDRQLNFSGAMRLAKGNRWRLAVLLYGTPILLAFLSSLSAYISTGVAEFLMGALFRWLLVPYEVAVLSVCYQRLTNIGDD